MSLMNLARQNGPAGQGSTQGVVASGATNIASSDTNISAPWTAPSMGQTQPTEQNEELDVAALQDMYKKFVTECPSGVLFLHEFKRFFGVDATGEASEYAENMFRAFDKNGDNTIDFLEFVAALNLVFRGDLEHKLRWSFKVYDKDSNGFIDKMELRAIIEYISDKEGIKKDPETPQLSVDEVCERIFKVIDVDGDGQITLEEFLEGAKRDPWILNMLRLDMNPSGWVLEQRRKSAFFESCGKLRHRRWQTCWKDSHDRLLCDKYDNWLLYYSSAWIT